MGAPLTISSRVSGATKPPQPHLHPEFDRIARPYFWLERLTFGRALEHTREHFLPYLSGCRRALILGDGDGRFTARLLSAHPHICADVIDSSARMLESLLARVHRATPEGPAHIATHLADARTFQPQRHDYDLIVTHFFLDCLTQSELDSSVRQIGSHTRPGAIWILSEFAIPSRGWMRVPARVIVRALYGAFRVLTGLHVSRLPHHAAALCAAGFSLQSSHDRLRGLLIAQLWLKRSH